MKEPEEILEDRMAAALAAAVPAMDVVGALAPAPDGEQKLSPDSYISVFADVASQDLDWESPAVPCTYSVRIGVHVATADDKTGTLFRDTCRAVRDVIRAFSGDNCHTLDTDGFKCDSLVLDTTETQQDLASETGGMAKIYNATVAGRYIPPTETTEQEES